MNLVKAADDIKNLSDQQLISAGQNPVMIPPYLVLAEMKRREQLRAEFAKAQQQPQPSVAQQVAQNLVQPQQGQSQQGMQQAPPQGIMQAAPPQAQAMAGGGIVGRYADGGKKVDPYGNLLSFLQSQYQSIGTPSAPTATAPASALSIADLAKRYPDRPLSDVISEIKSAYGPRDYSAEQRLVDYQMQMAEKKKPRIGDALIAAGAAMAANRDNRVGLANLLAQAIGTGSQAYGTAKQEQEKARNVGMMAQVALQRERQKDLDEMVNKAIEVKRSEAGTNLGKIQTIEANIRQVAEDLFRSTDRQQQAQLQTKLAALKGAEAIELARIHGAEAESRFSRSLAAAGMRGSDKSDRHKEEEKARYLAGDALMQARQWLSENPKVKADPLDLTINNINNNKFFAGYSPADRLRASDYIRQIKSKQIQDQAKTTAAEADMRRAQGPSLTGIMGAGAGQPGVDWGSREEDIAAKYAIPTQ